MKKLLLSILFIVFTQLTYGQFKVVGYLPDYRWTILNSIDYSKTTHILAAFANPDSSGTISFAQDIDAFATAVHNGGSKAMISIGGGGDYSWGYSYHIYEYLFTPANRTAFVMKLMDYVRLHQLDGIDLDIEGNALQLANYNLFSEELADSLHLLGLTISGAYVSGSWANYVSALTLQKLDFITTQSYGGVGSWNWSSPSDQSPLSLLESDVQFWENLGVPAAKVLGGIPFYVVEFPATPQATYWQFEPTLCSVYEGADYVGQYPLKNDLVYALNGDPVYLNSLKTLKKKVKYAAANAGGIMIWELGGDCYNGTLNVLDSLYSYIPQSVLSITDKSSSPDMRFYPNPANGFIKIDVSSQSEPIQSYTILDVYGREIRSATLSNSVIDVSKIEPGMYFINFIDNQTNHNPVPLVIQR